MQNNDTNQITGAIIIAGILIAGAILLKGSGTEREIVKAPGTPAIDITNDNNVANMKIRPVGRDDHILGNPNAEVMVVEYSDTECPFCKRFHDTMHQMVKQGGSEVAWVYRHYPIPELHAKAFKEAEATECAWEQGGNDTFWKYTDELYRRTQSNDSLDPAELPKIAADIGLNVASFSLCLESGKYKAKVESDIDNGNKTGVDGTPSSFILKNGTVVDRIAGAQPINIVMDQVEQALR